MNNKITLYFGPSFTKIFNEYSISSIKCGLNNSSPNSQKCQVESKLKFAQQLQFIQSLSKESNLTNTFGLNQIIDFFQTNPLSNLTISSSTLLTLKSEDLLSNASSTILGNLKYGSRCSFTSECSQDMFCDSTNIYPICNCNEGFNAMYSDSTGLLECGKKLNRRLN